MVYIYCSVNLINNNDDNVLKIERSDKRSSNHCRDFTAVITNVSFDFHSQEKYQSRFKF